MRGLFYVSSRIHPLSSCLLIMTTRETTLQATDMTDKPDNFKTELQMPSPPAVAMKILEAVRRDNFSAADLAGIISADPALTARVLRIANSPYYSRLIVPLAHHAVSEMAANATSRPLPLSLSRETLADLSPPEILPVCPTYSLSRTKASNKSCHVHYVISIQHDQASSSHSPRLLLTRVSVHFVKSQPQQCL